MQGKCKGTALRLELCSINRVLAAQRLLREGTAGSACGNRKEKSVPSFLKRWELPTRPRKQGSLPSPMSSGPLNVYRGRSKQNQSTLRSLLTLASSAILLFDSLPSTRNTGNDTDTSQSILFVPPVSDVLSFSGLAPLVLVPPCCPWELPLQA